MTALPAAGYIADNSRTEGEAKQALEDIVAFVRQLPGGAAASELTITSGAVTPTGAIHTIDTESDAAADDLDTMAVINIPVGGLVAIRPENAARVPTIKHAPATANGFNLKSARDFIMSAATDLLIVERRADDKWYEVLRFPSGIVQSVQATTNVETTSTVSAYTSIGLTVSITPRASTRIAVTATTSARVNRAPGASASGAWRLWNATTLTELSAADVEITATGATGVNGAGNVTLHADDVSATIGQPQTYVVQQFKVGGDSVTSQYFGRRATITAREIL